MGRLVKREIDFDALKEILTKEEALTEAEIEQVHELIALLEEKVGKKQEEPAGDAGDAERAASWESLAARYGFKEDKV